MCDICVVFWGVGDMGNALPCVMRLAGAWLGVIWANTKSRPAIHIFNLALSWLGVVVMAVKWSWCASGPHSLQNVRHQTPTCHVLRLGPSRSWGLCGPGGLSVGWPRKDGTS